MVTPPHLGNASQQLPGMGPSVSTSPAFGTWRVYEEHGGELQTTKRKDYINKIPHRPGTMLHASDTISRTGLVTSNFLPFGHKGLRLRGVWVERIMGYKNQAGTHFCHKSTATHFGFEAHGFDCFVTLCIVWLEGPVFWDSPNSPLKASSNAVRYFKL